MKGACLFAAMFCLGAMGCASVTVLQPQVATHTPDGREILETVDIMNTDWKLLCVLPIASGDPEKPNTVTCRWFRDTVSAENQMRMLEDECRRVGATQAVDVTTYENEEDVFLLAFLRRKLHTTATLLK